MSRDEAIEFVSSLPYLVAGSDFKLLRTQLTDNDYRYAKKALRERLETRVLEVAFQVSIGDREYTFETQPFYVLRSITLEEYHRVLPHGAKFKYYYEIHTD